MRVQTRLDEIKRKLFVSVFAAIVASFVFAVSAIEADYFESIAGSMRAISRKSSSVKFVSVLGSTRPVLIERHPGTNNSGTLAGASIANSVLQEWLVRQSCISRVRSQSSNFAGLTNRLWLLRCRILL